MGELLASRNLLDLVTCRPHREPTRGSHQNRTISPGGGECRRGYGSPRLTWKTSTTNPTSIQPLVERIALMGPQLARLDADILCLQEVNAHKTNGQFQLTALDQFLAGTL